MLKSLCFGAGIFLVMVGLSLHCLDSYTTRKRPSQVTTAFSFTPGVKKTVTPEPWKGWVYTGVGVVLILWTVTLPKRMGGK